MGLIEGYMSGLENTGIVKNEQKQRKNVNHHPLLRNLGGLFNMN